MVKVIAPAQFNRIVEFGTVASVFDENTGVNKSAFVKQFTLHAKLSQKTINQTYLAEQAKMLDTETLIIRHNAKVNNLIKCKMAGALYDIVAVSSSEVLGVNRYDYITIRKAKGVGV